MMRLSTARKKPQLAVLRLASIWNVGAPFPLGRICLARHAAFHSDASTCIVRLKPSAKVTA
jgi:hypothetical protein